MSAETGVEPAKVRKWFDNRKQKHRRLQQAADAMKKQRTAGLLVQKASQDALTGPKGPMAVKMAPRVFSAQTNLKCPVCSVSLRVEQSCESLECSNCKSVLGPDKHAHHHQQNVRRAMVLRLQRDSTQEARAETSQVLEQAMSALAGEVTTVYEALQAAQLSASFQKYRACAREAALKIMARAIAVQRCITQESRSSGQSAMLRTQTLLQLDILSVAFNKAWPSDEWGPTKLESGWRALTLRQLEILWAACLTIVSEDPRGSDRGRKQLVTANLEKMFGKQFVQNRKYSEFLKRQRRLWPRQDTAQEDDSGTTTINASVVVPVALLHRLKKTLKLQEKTSTQAQCGPEILSDAAEELAMEFRMRPTFAEYVTLCASKPTDMNHSDIARRLYRELSSLCADGTSVELQLTKMLVLEHECRDTELCQCLDETDDELLTEEMMGIVTRLAARTTANNNNQNWVIKRALAYAADELPYCAGVIEDLFLHYDHQVRAFAEWRKQGFSVDLDLSGEAATWDKDNSHFLLYVGDAFFAPSEPGLASTMSMSEVKQSEKDALLLPKILGWMSAARAAFVQL